MTELSVLHAILNRDPDGGTVQPTPAAYANHRTWAIGTYGKSAWADYLAGGWGNGEWY